MRAPIMDRVATNPVVSAPVEPPLGLRATLRHLGPSFILVGSVVGSRELILTTTLGASVGFVMLWWGCTVQAGCLRQSRSGYCCFESARSSR